MRANIKLLLPRFLSTMSATLDAGPVHQSIHRYAVIQFQPESLNKPTPRPLDILFTPWPHSFRRKLQESLKPSSLHILNESHKHAGHAGNPTGAADAETHFKVEIVSEAFEGKNLVQRHRMVYQLVSDELQAGLHALTLKTSTPKEAVER